jgi:ABC-2 type transport system ATP-binding protein
MTSTYRQMIDIQGMQKMQAGNILLDIPELQIARGEIAGVTGPAGSGKSVLFELLIGHSLPSAGVVRIAGVDPARDRLAFSHQAGVLFSSDSLYKNLDPLGNLSFHCRLHGLPKSRAIDVLAEVGLADQAQVKLDQLSGGLQRRLALGRAILHQPAVLLLDEPFIRCDQATIDIMEAVIRQQQDRGTAVLILAVDQAPLAGLCDPLYRLQNGRLQPVLTFDEKNEQGENQPKTPFKIPVKGEDKVILINPAEILYADAGDGRAFVITKDGRLATQFTLTELEERLQRSGFFRTHRSYLVNLQHIREVVTYTRNSFSLRLDDDSGTMIPLSKSSAAELRELLGY